MAVPRLDNLSTLFLTPKLPNGSCFFFYFYIAMLDFPCIMSVDKGRLLYDSFLFYLRVFPQNPSTEQMGSWRYWSNSGFYINYIDSATNHEILWISCPRKDTGKARHFGFKRTMLSLGLPSLGGDCYLSSCLVLYGSKEAVSTTATLYNSKALDQCFL